jgi:sortase B
MEKTLRILIRSIERIVSTAFLAVLLLLLFFAVYVTVSDRRIVAEASSAVYESYKPTEDGSASFDELVSINHDVVGWLTMDDTKIDYPLVRGRNNEIYINTAVSGEFSLSGSLFLDFRNAADFSDPLSIVYGHNMAGDVMFGGIDNYADPSYYADHLTGTLFCGGEYYKLEVFAYFEADGHDMRVYAPRLQPTECADWLEMVGALAVNRAEMLPEEGPILLMSTCAVGETNGRNLLAAAIRPGGSPPPVTESHKSRSGGLLAPSAEERSPWVYLVPAGVVLLGLTVLYAALRRRKKR